MALFPIFFAPALITVLTMNVFYMCLMPLFWLIFWRIFAKNQHRPIEYWFWIKSGAAFKSWNEWGGVSEDPIGSETANDLR